MKTSDVQKRKESKHDEIDTKLLSVAW
jgi:hypothetical protein